MASRHSATLRGGVVCSWRRCSSQSAITTGVVIGYHDAHILARRTWLTGGGVWVAGGGGRGSAPLSNVSISMISSITGAAAAGGTSPSVTHRRM